jgi:hypothetical protein
MASDASVALKSPPFAGSFAELKERQLVFRLVRQLAEAQFQRGDRNASERLWQEAAALEIDPERIIDLLYAAADPSDNEEMERIDSAHRCSRPRRGWGWLGRFGGPPVRPPVRGAWHRTSPRARPQAHPAVR